MSRPLVSISMLTLNALEYTQKAVVSVLRHTPSLELLITDNGSTDGTQRWLKRMSAEDPRITLTLNPTNEGFIRPHNRANIAGTACNQDHLSTTLMRANCICLTSWFAIFFAWAMRFTASLCMYKILPFFPLILARNLPLRVLYSSTVNRLIAVSFLRFYSVSVLVAGSMINSLTLFFGASRNVNKITWSPLSSAGSPSGTSISRITYRPSFGILIIAPPHLASFQRYAIL